MKFESTNCFDPSVYLGKEKKGMKTRKKRQTES